MMHGSRSQSPLSPSAVKFPDQRRAPHKPSKGRAPAPAADNGMQYIYNPINSELDEAWIRSWLYNAAPPAFNPSQRWLKPGCGKPQRDLCLGIARLLQPYRNKDVDSHQQIAPTQHRLSSLILLAPAFCWEHLITYQQGSSTKNALWGHLSFIVQQHPAQQRLWHPRLSCKPGWTHFGSPL